MSSGTRFSRKDNVKQQGSWVLNFVQDIATAHNNAVIRELVKHREIDLRLYYARLRDKEHRDAHKLAGQIVPAMIYGSRLPNAKVVLRAVFSTKEKWLIVAWSNPTSRALILMFWLTRRRFNCWIDVPPATSKQRLLLRKAVLWFLRSSNVQMLAVGSFGVRYLQDAGFPEERITNLPIAVDLPEVTEISDWRRRLGVVESSILLVTGSRLTEAKGFDDLVRAVARLPADVRDCLATVIIGSGCFEERLIQTRAESGLDAKEVQIISWLEYEEFISLAIEADALVHPSRFDSFGGMSVIARALSKPLIASTGAGSAVDIVVQGRNGWLFEPGDSRQLADILENIVSHRYLLTLAGREMQQISSQGAPSEIAGKMLKCIW